MKKRSQLRRVLFIILAAAFAAAPSYFKVFENFELATYDLRSYLRIPQPQNEDVAIIEISNDTLEAIGRWPLRRDWHAKIIDILSAYGARMIIFDILFSEPGPDDTALIESTKNAGNVYYAFGFALPAETKTPDVEADRIDTSLLAGLKKEAKGYGFINAAPDRDGKTRRALLKVKYKGATHSHLALLAASDYLGTAFSDTALPLDEDGRFLINFAGRWKETFKHYSYIDIFTSYSRLIKGQKGVVDLNTIRDKVCFVGLTATGTHDLNPVPFAKRYPGVGTHANVFNSITTKSYLRRATRGLNLAILALFILITAAVTLTTRPLVSFISVVSLVLLFSALAAGLFVFADLWIDIFYPVITIFILYLLLTFYKYITERHKRELIEKELEVAKKIQRSFLPTDPPASEDIAISARMFPAKQVGGDLYDFVALPDGKTGIMIGDVSGKGVPAALYMAKAVSLFRHISQACSSTKDAVTKLNDALSEESGSNLFVTLTYLIYDPKKKALLFSSGGHLPTLLLKEGQDECRLLEAKEGIPLGLMPGDFDQQSVILSKGDKLVLYTDGVTEAMSKMGEEFTEKRAIEAAQKSRAMDSQGLLDAIEKEVFDFSRSAPQHDDITIITIEIK